MSGLKDKKLITKQTYTKNKTCKLYSIESFEYFCQISSKSIVIILSYTVSKFACFLRHMCTVYVIRIALGRTHQLHKAKRLQLDLKADLCVFSTFSQTEAPQKRGPQARACCARPIGLQIVQIVSH